MSETNVDPTNCLDIIEQLRYDRDKYIGMWRSQCTIAEEVMRERDRLMAELDRYKQGVEVDDFVNRFGMLEAEYELPSHLRDKQVRVLVIKEEE